MAKYCVNCGCAMDENTAVCLNCGTPAYSPEASEPKPAVPPAPAGEPYAPPAQIPYAPPAKDAYAPPAQGVYTPPPAQGAYTPAPAQQTYPAGGFTAPASGQYTAAAPQPVRQQGAPAVTVAPPFAPAQEQKQPKKGGKKIVVIAVIAVLAIVGIVLAVVLSKGGSIEAPIDAICKAIETGRTSYVTDCLPDVYSGDREDLADMKEKARDDINDIRNEIISEFGTGFKMSYKILSDVTVTGSELSEAKSILPNISEVHDLTVRLKVTSASGEIYEWDSEDIRVYKQSGKWVFLW